MDNTQAAATLVEMYGELAQYQDKNGNSTVPEYAEAISIAIMALKENNNDA